MAWAYPQIPGVEFRNIEEYPGYAVSSDGQVWNSNTCGRRSTWRRMAMHGFWDGSVVVRLGHSGGCASVRVVELLARYFPN